jgi:hypothetical protein
MVVAPAATRFMLRAMHVRQTPKPLAGTVKGLTLG